MRVHILVSVVDPEQLAGSTLVFRTLRTAFPHNEIVIWGNDLPLSVEEFVRTQGIFVNLEYRISHDEWIEDLLKKENEEFYICDTDMVFFGNVANWKFEAAIAGRFEPAFKEPWSKTNKAARLHTCLMYFNPKLVRRKIMEYMSRTHPHGFPFAPDVVLIKQHFIPQGLKTIFYDTCAGLYHAIGGQIFTREQNETFEHLHCGTYARRIAKSLPGILDVHERIFKDHNLARGLQEQQNRFYEENRI